MLIVGRLSENVRIEPVLYLRREATQLLMEPPTIETQQPARQIRTRNEYYRGDLDCPPQYLVLQCTNSHTHHAPRGRHDARRGCGRHFVNYTAKHWGHKADWQSTCPNCGRKQRRNRGHVRPELVFDTRAEAWQAANRTNGFRAASQAVRKMISDHHAGKPLNPEYVRVWAFDCWDGFAWEMTHFEESVNKHCVEMEGDSQRTREWLEAISTTYGVDF
jgi:hypothetical protein